MSIRAYNDEGYLHSLLAQLSDSCVADGCSDPTEPVWVYSLFSEDDRYLYVGVASILSRRLTQHRRTKPWWPEVDTLLADLACCRYHAMQLEAHAIRHEQPQYNVALPAPHRVIPNENASLGLIMLFQSTGEL